MQLLARKRLWAEEHGQLPEAGKGKARDSPLEPLEGMKLCWHEAHLILDPWNPFQTSDLQNYKIINLCYSKPLTLWSFVKATTGKEQNNQNFRDISPLSTWSFATHFQHIITLWVQTWLIPRAMMSINPLKSIWGFMWISLYNAMETF